MNRPDQNLNLAVGALIKNAEGKMLVLKRSSQSFRYPSLWELSGGKVDAGELAEEAVIREVREETGLSIEVREEVARTTFDLDDKTITYVCFQGETQEASIELSDEHEVFLWVDREELQGLGITPALENVTDQINW